MVTMTTAENALKSFYLDAVSDSLNFKVNPFLAQIKQSTAEVMGKDVRKAVRFGLNGAIGAGTETGALPEAAGGKYAQLVSTLKNLYGTIEISDKAMRASRGSEGAFVNLLNDEMDGLVKSASFNFGRMLFGDGTGYLAEYSEVGKGNKFKVSSTKNLFEGMRVYVLESLVLPAEGVGMRTIKAVDRANGYVYLDGSDVSSVVPESGYLGTQESDGAELTGLEAIFTDYLPLYGLDRDEYPFLKGYAKGDVGDISEIVIQKAIDEIEERSGGTVNFIVCSWGVRRALVEYYKKQGTMMPTMEIEGGNKSLSFNGIPVVADRFCPDGTMYLLNTDDFKLCQLCDWEWLEGEDGKILHQVPNKPVFTATLVKYAELLCERPCGQGKLSGITEA